MEFNNHHMEQKISNKNVAAFCRLMRRQGYSGKYIPLSGKHMPTDLPVELKGYLRKFLVGYWHCKGTLHLAIKLNRTPHVRCVFTVGFEEAEGFRAKKIYPRDVDTSLEKTIRVGSNAEVLTLGEVLADFPKCCPGKTI